MQNWHELKNNNMDNQCSEGIHPYGYPPYPPPPPSLGAPYVFSCGISFFNIFETFKKSENNF